jgi:glyoxylase-like metal-dependent hydrolase (beta-lactamase superfamily II)
MLPPIERFRSSTGAEIYRIPVEAFPGNLIVYCYVVLEAGVPTLIDTGSGYGTSNDDLLAGLGALAEQFDISFAVEDIQHVLITHGHIDHFGGIAHILEKTNALVGIHPLDRRVLTNYEERVIVATKDLRVYLERAGVRDTLIPNLLDMYGFAKRHVRSVKVDFTLEEGSLFEGLEFLHTPGHCPGQVCILIGDILISADHILARITPHQAPESITNYTGLGHYLEALQKIERVDGIRLALGGHEAPVEDVYKRLGEIQVSHQRKLERIRDVLANLEEPATINELSQQIYPDRHGYDILLAIEEVGAHVEYLYEHGQLAITNLNQVEQEDNPALLYSLA